MDATRKKVYGGLAVLTVVCLVYFFMPDAPNIYRTAILNAKQQVALALKDPGSAVFEGEYNVLQGRTKDGFYPITTCGYVNAKNSFGGYAGRTRYVVKHIADDKKQVTTYPASLEQSEFKKRMPDDRFSDESYFDHFYWNVDCVDDRHSAVYSYR